MVTKQQSDEPKKKAAVLLLTPNYVELLHLNFSLEEFLSLQYSGTDTLITLGVEYFVPHNVEFISFYGITPVTFFKGDSIVFNYDQYGLAQQMLNRIFRL